MIRFSNPYFMFLLIVVFLFLLGEFLISRFQHRRIREIASEENYRILSDRQNTLFWRIRMILLYSALVFLVIALTGPQIGTALKKVKREGVDIVVAVDVSLSMQAEDVKPNRLMRAKYEISRFIDGLRGDRIGLIAFAGVSYLQCPLTLDYGAAKLFLDIIDTKLIGTQGTAIKDALQTAVSAFGEKKERERIVVILSDGEDHEGNLEKAVSLAKEAGIIVYGVGIGTISGAPIPIKDPQTGMGFKKDRSGHVVTSALKEDFLYQLADETGGKYYRLTDSPHALSDIYESILSREREEFATHQYSQFEERYQYFLFLALILLMAEFLIPETGLRKRKDEFKSLTGFSENIPEEIQGNER